MESNFFGLPSKTCVVVDPAANSNDPIRWESRGLMIEVHRTLDSGQPPITIDLASTLGATSDLPLAIKKACRLWFDPIIKTKVDVVRYVNAVCRQNGFKISTLSNSKQGLDRRAQLVCSRGIVARKPRGKSQSVQTTTTRPITASEKCPFSITVYECRKTGRWYIRKYGNGSNMHCGHCQLLPEQVGIRQFQSLTGRKGDDWSDEQANMKSTDDEKEVLGNNRGDQSANGKLDTNGNASAALLAQAKQRTIGLDFSSDNTGAQAVDRDRRRINGIHAGISHLSDTNYYDDRLFLQQAELRRLQDIEARLIGPDWSVNRILPQNQRLALYDDLRSLRNHDDRLFLDRQLGSLPVSRIGLLRSFARRNELMSIRNNLSNYTSVNNDPSILMQQREIRRRVAMVAERYAIGWNGHKAPGGITEVTPPETGRTIERASNGIPTSIVNHLSVKSVIHQDPRDSKLTTGVAARIQKNSEAKNCDHRSSSTNHPTETEKHPTGCKDHTSKKVPNRTTVVSEQSELEMVESNEPVVIHVSGEKNLNVQKDETTDGLDRCRSITADRHGSNDCVVNATECKGETGDANRVNESDSNSITIGDTNESTDENFEDDYSMLQPMVIYDYPSNQNSDNSASEQDALSSVEQTSTDGDQCGTKQYQKLKHHIEKANAKSSRLTHNKRQKTI